MTSDDDEYDDDVLQLAEHSILLSSTSGFNSPSQEKLGRKRTSKACDSCRKAKCKCERSAAALANGDPCRSCVLLGAECTFLGPSRKRGPPKGYIDTLESKLHQMEALLGTIISSSDHRARSLVADLSKDALAREIIQRVDATPFGTLARKQAAASRVLYGPESLPTNSKRRESTKARSDATYRHGFTGPPHEWQDTLESLLIAPTAFEHLRQSSTASNAAESDIQSTISTTEDHSFAATNYAYDSINPHQRRRIHTESPPPNHNDVRRLGSLFKHSSAASGLRRIHSSSALGAWAGRNSPHSATPPQPSSACSPIPYEDVEDESSNLADVLGQLSVNDVQQVRYHGKAAGLHLLTPAMDTDPWTTRSGKATRFNHGFWVFPPPGVWPAPASSQDLPGAASKSDIDLHFDAGAAKYLPDRLKQGLLLELYFTYVHPILPIVTKSTFLRDFAIRGDVSHPEHSAALVRIPNVLLLAMFSVAARYECDASPAEDGTLWTAGDYYFNHTRGVLLNYASLSRIALIQSVLLMGYREVGMGGMAHAWVLVGFAARIAFDLGLHRSLAKWETSGRQVFTDDEKEVRSRIWYSCVRLDRYISTYIGRPVGIQERDFDTKLPEEEKEEEEEPWVEHPSWPSSGGPAQRVPHPSRVISCFKASITLSNILGSIVSTQYAIRLPSLAFRHRERLNLEMKLSRWLLDLPSHLRLGQPGKPPSPHVLVLHMQYWCTLLLLNRPFLQSREGQLNSPSSPGSAASLEATAASSVKVFGTCESAAHHITQIGSVFAEVFCMRRAPALLSYYLFTAAIMHVTSLIDNPADVQASLAFRKTVEIMKRMATIWPSAERACGVLDGVRIDMRPAEMALLTNAPTRKKRSAEDLAVPGDVNTSLGSAVQFQQGAFVPTRMFDHSASISRPTVELSIPSQARLWSANSSRPASVASASGGDPRPFAHIPQAHNTNIHPNELASMNAPFGPGVLTYDTWTVHDRLQDYPRLEDTIHPIQPHGPLGAFNHAVTDDMRFAYTPTEAPGRDAFPPAARPGAVSRNLTTSFWSAYPESSTFGDLGLGSMADVDGQEGRDGRWASAPPRPSMGSVPEGNPDALRTYVGGGSLEFSGLFGGSG